MTNEHEGQEPGAEQSRPPGMQPEEHDDSSVLEGAGDFTSGEGLVAFAGMVLVAVWLIFGVLANTYWVGWLAVMPAIAVIVLPRLERASVERFHPLSLLMKVLGYAIALVGALTIIENIRFAGSALDEVLEVFGAIAAYAGFVMAFVGARQINT